MDLHTKKSPRALLQPQKFVVQGFSPVLPSLHDLEGSHYTCKE